MLLAALRAGPASRAALASRTGLTRATVASLLDPLVRVGVLVEETAAPAGPGRPARPVGFGPRSPVAVGVSIEVDAVVAGASGLDGVSAGRRRVPRDHRALTAEAIYAGAAQVAADLAAELGRPVLGTGLALPALLSGTPDDTVVVRAPNLPALNGTRPTLSPAPAPTPRRTARSLTPGEPTRRSPGRVLVGNEATFGALAHLDVAPDLVYVSADVGIGGGLVVDGRVLRGTRGFAGEIGHVVVEPDGPACGCGGRGCVEQFAGRDALLATSGCADLAALRRALERGEPSAVEAVRRAGTALGVGLSSVVNVVDLPVVVLGGLFAELVPHLLPAVEAELATRCMGHPPERVVASRHGDAATVRGAAEAVLAEVLADPDRLLELP
ncbi:ROK family protein [Pseudonocardia oroxyli]|uniref:Sugar kinase of the NBD/HSP70 family, may contain an N-terminal HTH domain n=1 Tax=Pseudonocardia oroxyli TaxID=366584 RepID=A0A1G7JSG7_PSEOR|nr:ROK family protein [Pseudonocardia oroxyli]SDF27805.1 Sugar kinase of the NBD/HSP70 family, may contain an N-terminal HTH domain [Pseudonocardia oroxyli]